MCIGKLPSAWFAGQTVLPRSRGPLACAQKPHVTLPISRTGANAGYEAARAYLRGRIAVAQDLAVGDGHDEARALLANLQAEIAGADDDIVALFFQVLRDRQP